MTTKTTTTAAAAPAPAMPIADRLEHCAKFTGLDAVRELLIEAAQAVRKRDAVIRQAAEALENASPAAWASRVDSDTMKSIWRKHAEALVGLQRLLEEPTTLTGCNCRCDGDTQAQWCDLHLAHKEAIHEWAERAKEAEKQLALRPERVPMTEEQIRSMCKQGWVFETVKQWVRIIEAHHGITAQAKKE